METLGIATELRERWKALAARLSPQARRLAFPNTYDQYVAKRTIVEPTFKAVGSDWTTANRQTKYDKADAARVKARVVVNACARIWQVPAGQIYDVPQKAIYVRPRQASMALMRDVLELSQPVIGIILNRDHTTVLSGLRKHADIYETNADYAAKYDQAHAELVKVFKPNVTPISDTGATADDKGDGRTERPSLLSSAHQREAA